MNDDERPALLGGEPIWPAGPPTWPPDWPEVREAASRCLADGSWGRYHGPNGERLAAQIGGRHGAAHVELCSSGTIAVELALRGLGVGPDDEVVMSAYDFKGNFSAVLAVGARPVLVDVDAATGNLDVRLVAAALTSKTKAVVASHLHGSIVDMPQLTRVADAAGVGVVEDACQMPGAVVAGRPAGAWGRVGALSFGGSKLLTAGRGGALFTNDSQIAQRIRTFCQRGNHAFPLSELQAAVLAPQWDLLDDLNLRRSAAIERLSLQLPRTIGLRPFSCVASEFRPAYYKWGFWYDRQGFGGLRREVFCAAMQAEGVAMAPGFRSLHRSHARRRFHAPADLPHASLLDDQVVVLHHLVLLAGDEALDAIPRAVEKIRHASMTGLLDDAAPVSPTGEE